jgi:hypothetical protein
MLRRAMPDLPDEPAQDQVDAWVELAELTQDPEFRATVRRAAIDQARTIREAGQPSPEAQAAMVELMRERLEPAAEAGVPPNSAEGRALVDEAAAAWARQTGRTDGPEFRAWLADRLEASSDSRYERYWQLLAVINGWEQTSGLTAAGRWLLAGLRAG